MSGSSNVDPSIPLQAGRGTTQPENPLQMVGQFANVQNALNANRLFPGQLQQQQQATQAGAVSLAEHIQHAAYGAMAPLLALPPGTITHAVLTSNLASTEHNLGIPTSGVLSDLAATSPTGDGAEFDAKVRALIASRSQPSAESAVGMVTPGTGPIVSTGQGQFGTTVAPRGSPGAGQITASGLAAPEYPSTTTNMQQVQWQTPDGVTHTGTAAQRAASLGIPPGALGPASGVSGGLAPVVGAGGPATPQNPPRLGGGAAGATAGPMPGTPEAETASALSAHAANQRAATFATDMYPLVQAQKALASAPTGKGSEAVHDVSSYINTFSPAWAQKALSFVTLGAAMTPDQVAAYDEAKKYLTQGQLGQSGAARSDAGLSTAGAASPSTTISKEAAQLVLRGMIGLRRMEQEGTLEFNNSGQPPANYDKFMASFSTAADPRVYTFDQMTPAERQQTIAGLKTPAKIAAFQAAVKRSEDNGILSAPGPQ